MWFSEFDKSSINLVTQKPVYLYERGPGIIKGLVGIEGLAKCINETCASFSMQSGLLDVEELMKLG